MKRAKLWKRLAAGWGVVTMAAGGLLVTATAASADVADFLPLRADSARVSSTWNHAGAHPDPYAIDFAVPTGTQVIAAGHGKVIGVGTDNNGSKYVSIFHQDHNRTSQYLHLSSMQVSVGDTVVTGQNIAKSGATGNNVTGPHLHYQEQAGSVAFPTRSRVHPGTLYACHGSRLVSYASGPALWGATVRNDGTGCLGKAPAPKPQPKPLTKKFTADAKSKLYIDQGGARLNLQVCGKNIKGKKLTVRLTRPGRDFGNVSATPTSTCHTFWDLEGKGYVLKSTTYTTRLAMNQNPSVSWPVPCGAATGGQGLCDRKNT